MRNVIKLLLVLLLIVSVGGCSSKNKENEQLKSNIASMEKKILDLEKNVLSLTKSKSELEKQNRSKDSKISQANKWLVSWKESYRNKKNEIRAKDNMIAQLKTQLSKYSNYYANMQKAVAKQKKKAIPMDGTTTITKIKANKHEIVNRKWRGHPIIVCAIRVSQIKDSHEAATYLDAVGITKEGKVIRNEEMILSLDKWNYKNHADLINAVSDSMARGDDYMIVKLKIVVQENRTSDIWGWSFLDKDWKWGRFTELKR